MDSAFYSNGRGRRGCEDAAVASFTRDDDDDDDDARLNVTHNDALTIGVEHVNMFLSRAHQKCNFSTPVENDIFPSSGQR